MSSPPAAAPAPAGVQVLPVLGLGEIGPGADLAELLAAAAPPLRDGDIVVVTSKVVSKAEGRVLPVDSPGDREAAIDAEAVRTVASWDSPNGRTRVVVTRHGFVLAAAGVDASNTPPGTVVLLPVDPDASARRLRAALAGRLGLRLAVVVTDTFGRPWRLGQTDVAIGAAGLVPVADLRGQSDGWGNPLGVTVTALLDEIAAAADLVKGKLAGVPAAVLRGLGSVVVDADGPGAAALVRPLAQDMFARGSREAARDGAWAAVLGPRVAPGGSGEPGDVPGLVAAAVAALAPRLDPALRLQVHPADPPGHPVGSVSVLGAEQTAALLVAAGAALARLGALLAADGVACATQPTTDPAGRRDGSGTHRFVLARLEVPDLG